MPMSRIIMHARGDIGLELIKQERTSAHQLTSADIIGGCGSSSSLIDDDLDQDECDDGVDVTLNHHHHNHHHNHQHSHHNNHSSAHHQSGQPSHMNDSNAIATTKIEHEGLSVIVQPQDQDDSHDPDDSSSQLLSPSGKITPNSAEMIDTSDFRALHEPTYQTLTSVNGMSPPGFSPNSSSYATLTPLQPLPPISTMSDKFAYGHSSGSGSFSVMQNNNISISLGMGVTSPYNYDKLPTMGLSPPHSYSSPPNTLSGNGNGLHSPQKSMSPNEFDPPYGSDHRDLLANSEKHYGKASRMMLQDHYGKTLRESIADENNTNNSANGSGQTRQLQSHSPALSPQSVSLHSPGGSAGGGSIITSFNSPPIGVQSSIQQQQQQQHHHSRKFCLCIIRR